MEYFRVDLIKKMILEHLDLWRWVYKPCGYLEEERSRHRDQSVQRPWSGSSPAMFQGRYQKTTAQGQIWHQLFLFIKFCGRTAILIVHIFVHSFFCAAATELSSCNRNLKAFKILMIWKTLWNKFANPYSRGQCWSEVKK